MTDISVRSVLPATRDKWLSVARECPYATYFHTPYWYELIAPKQKHVALDVTFNDGASAVIPVAEIKRVGGLLTDNFSSPGGTYGGWISASALTPEHVKRLFNVLISKNNLTFRINPLDRRLSSLLPSSMPLPSKMKLTDDFTQALDLTEGINNLRNGMSRGHRSAINTAARSGVTVKRAETLDEWERYYELYLGSVDRWRAGKLRTRTVYPAALFKRVYKNRAENEMLWLAMRGGEPIAGALIFYWGGHAVYWHGAALASHFAFRPNNLLFWEIISDAARRGYKIFDFNPSGGYGGVESFKERFGAERLPTPIISTKTPLRSLISAVRRRLRSVAPKGASNEQKD